MQATIERPRRNGLPAPSMDRTPPHSIEAEQGILGCILQDPAAIHECYEKLKLPDCFYDFRHAEIFLTAAAMIEAHKPVDGMSMQIELRNRNQLEAVGGLAYIGALIDGVPSAANIGYYVEIVREKYLLRQLIQTCSRAVTMAYENQETPDQVLADTEAAILSIGKLNADEEDRPIMAIVQDAVSEIEADQVQDGPVGLPTGFFDLDRKLQGLKPGEVTVLAARPSCGKTSLAMNIAEHIGIQCGTGGLHVAVFSLEMSAVSLVKRMISSRARVNLRDVKQDMLVDDMAKLTKAASAIASSRLHIVDRSMSLPRLRAKARRIHQRVGLSLLIVDYIGLMQSAGRPGQSREQQISEMSAGLKQLAKELRIPVMILSQLNRDLEKDKNRRPRLSDLRESGAIEQDADVVILLYPKQKEDDADYNPEIVPVGAIIAKHRNGPTGEIGMIFRKCFTRLESEARIQDN